VNDENSKVKELEAQKLALIEKYMKMQDEADDLNERIYRVCCEVEAMNLAIDKAKEEEAKRKAMAAKSALNPPPNGKSHSHAPIHHPPDPAAN
jgi:membrane protein involved in colicin uptake